MKKWFALLVAVMALAACTSFGPPAIHLSRSELAERAFFDRGIVERLKTLGAFSGMSITMAGVGVHTQAQRLQLEWAIRLKETLAGLPLGVDIAISGRPELNESRTGLDLADARVEYLRLTPLPLPGGARPTEGESLGRLPLLQFRSDELNRDGIVYEPTSVSLGVFGLRVALAPR